MVKNYEMGEIMKRFMLGFILGGLIFSSATAFAAVGDKIEATIVNYKLVIDGKEITDLVVQYDHQGTTLMSIRQIANLMGYDVTFKSDTKTVDFSKPTQTSEVTTMPEQPMATPTLSPTPSPTPDIGTQIGIINDKVTDRKVKIRTLQIALDDSNDSPNREFWKTQLDQYNSELQQLEQQKADLESQLQ